MSGSDKSMDEILEDIRALSRGEDPPPREEPEAPRDGHLKAALLVVLAALAAIPLLSELARIMNLPPDGYGYISVVLALFIVWKVIERLRPASLRHWAIMVAAALSAGASSAVAATGVYWLIARFAPAFMGGTLAALAVLVACNAAILLTLWLADRLSRSDNLIFPAETDGNEEGAA